MSRLKLHRASWSDWQRSGLRPGEAGTYPPIEEETQ
jgi:hypothetical protein